MEYDTTYIQKDIWFLLAFEYLDEERAVASHTHENCHVQPPQRHFLVLVFVYLCIHLSPHISL